MAAAVAAREICTEAIEGRKKRRRVAGRRRWNGVRTACILIAAMALFLAYVGVYAKVTHMGFQRAALVSELRKARLENEALRVEIQNLTNPDRLASAAEDAGMLPGTDVSFVKPPQPVTVAKRNQAR